MRRTVWRDEGGGGGGGKEESPQERWTAGPVDAFGLGPGVTVGAPAACRSVVAFVPAEQDGASHGVAPSPASRLEDRGHDSRSAPDCVPAREEIRAPDERRQRGGAGCSEHATRPACQSAPNGTRSACHKTHPRHSAVQPTRPTAARIRSGERRCRLARSVLRARPRMLARPLPVGLQPPLSVPFSRMSRGASAISAARWSSSVAEHLATRERRGRRYRGALVEPADQ